jgi:predicted  nucleic acid-binding Zn-ribbon protein
MVDRITSDNDPSLADMLLGQIAEAEKKFRDEVGALQAELSRLNAELDALKKELDALLAEPGDHQKEIAEVEKKMADRKLAIDTLVDDQIKPLIEKYRHDIAFLTATLAELDEVIKDIADKTGR